MDCVVEPMMELPVTNANMTNNNASVQLSWNSSKQPGYSSNISGQLELLGPSDYMYAYVTVFCSVIFLVGVLGNVLVIQVVRFS
ncbi:hypothetical protein Btru_010164 [Bulinus truncatus]|nr:hypothetical protein Btru_010164 [Bulinus truncatus]